MQYPDNLTIYKRMKIIVSIIKSKEGRKHCIEVVDGENVLRKETAETIIERDRKVWDLADMYNVLDIQIEKKIKQTSEPFKYSEIPSIPILDEEGADEYFEDNRGFVYDRVLRVIGEGLHERLTTVRLFELNGAGVYLTSEQSSWKEGLEACIKHFIQVEEYEKCIIAKQLLHDLSIL